jgi:tellurite resistance protein
MMMQHQTFIVRLAIFWASALVAEVDSFVVPLPSSRVPALSASSTAVSGFMDSINEFFEELDAFIDDATSRRLGAGAAFYGKRKSNVS